MINIKVSNIPPLHHISKCNILYTVKVVKSMVVYLPDVTEAARRSHRSSSWVYLYVSIELLKREKDSVVSTTNRCGGCLENSLS